MEMKLFWAHNINYPEDVTYYVAEDEEGLYEEISLERKLDIEKVKETFAYGELSKIYNEKHNKYFNIAMHDIIVLK